MNQLVDYINNDCKPFSKDSLVEDLQLFFEDLPYSHFPVLDDGVYIGCVSSEDVETFDPKTSIFDYRYAFEGFFVRQDAIWIDVLEVFAQHNCNIMPILDASNQYLGYYELTDIIKFLNNTPFLREQGAILIVQKEMKEYSFSQIVQIVESNGGSILGCFVSALDNGIAQITIKTTVGSINEIIQTFRRYEYEVLSQHMEDAYINELKERSEYLDKYLNI